MSVSDTQSSSNGSLPHATVLALTFLVLGFALERISVGQTLSDAVAIGLAWVSSLLLVPFGFDLARDGVELRSASEGWAVRVSDVCDGIGLIVALVAVAIALWGSGPGKTYTTLARQILVGIAAILLFNLVRVIVLVLVLGWATDSFETVHLVIFPFLTFVLISALFVGREKVLLLWGMVVGLAALWQVLSGAFVPVLMALSNLVLNVIAPAVIGDLVTGARGLSVVETLLIANLDSVQLFSAPFAPLDFMVALPMVVAASILSRSLWPLVMALVFMMLALICGVFTAVWALADAQAPVKYLVSDGAGAFTVADYVFPAAMQTTVAVLQNTFVHFNFLVLPILLMVMRVRRDV